MLLPFYYIYCNNKFIVYTNNKYYCTLFSKMTWIESLKMVNGLEYLFNNGELVVNISGNNLMYTSRDIKNSLIKIIDESDIKSIKINASKLESWDSTLVVILYKLINLSKEKNIDIDAKSLPDGLVRLLKLAFSVDRKPEQDDNNKNSFLENLGGKTLNAWGAIKSGLSFLAETARSMGRFFTSKAIMRKIDFMFALEDCSFKALPIVSLISFMVGLIFGFVGSVQLKLFGAEIYVASLVAIAMVRVMGAVMTGIIMAGRTGSSYAATIGTMQVNEEVDALKTMGIPISDFLLLPRIMSLMVMMPILTMFSDIMGMLGGAFVGIFMLDLSIVEYWNTSINSLSLTHFFVGIVHGFVFGCVIAICGCYYGIKSGKDADSVGKATTNSVVASIIWIIISTAILTVICQSMGI